MSEKRFVEHYAGRTIKRLIGIKDIETNRVCVTIEENIQLLNELHEENQSFEIHSKWQGEKYSELLDSFTKMKKNYQLVKKENEQLKQQLRKKYGVGGKMSECKDYGLKCLKCPYWNHWTNFCTKWKITTSTSGD